MVLKRTLSNFASTPYDRLEATEVTLLDTENSVKDKIFDTVYTPLTVGSIRVTATTSPVFRSCALFVEKVRPPSPIFVSVI